MMQSKGWRFQLAWRRSPFPKTDVKSHRVAEYALQPEDHVFSVSECPCNTPKGLVGDTLIHLVRISHNKAMVRVVFTQVTVVRGFILNTPH
jgi:hypothetical protein